MEEKMNKNNKLINIDGMPGVSSKTGLTSREVYYKILTR
jgi:hypothetical protein